jgi:hypothetical protein
MGKQLARHGTRWQGSRIAVAGLLNYELPWTGGKKRTYLLHVPKTYKSSRPTPLVICLPGFGELEEFAAALTDLLFEVAIPEVSSQAERFIRILVEGDVVRAFELNHNPYCFERDGREQRDDTGFEWIIKAGYRLFFSRLSFKSERASELLLCERHVECEYEKQQESSPYAFPAHCCDGIGGQWLWKRTRQRVWQQQCRHQNIY